MISRLAEAFFAGKNEKEAEESKNLEFLILLDYNF